MTNRHQVRARTTSRTPGASCHSMRNRIMCRRSNPVAVLCREGTATRRSGSLCRFRAVRSCAGLRRGRRRAIPKRTSETPARSPCSCSATAADGFLQNFVDCVRRDFGITGRGVGTKRWRPGSAGVALVFRAAHIAHLGCRCIRRLATVPWADDTRLGSAMPHDGGLASWAIEHTRTGRAATTGQLGDKPGRALGTRQTATRTDGRPRAVLDVPRPSPAATAAWPRGRCPWLLGICWRSGSRAGR